MEDQEPVDLNKMTKAELLDMLAGQTQRIADLETANTALGEENAKALEASAKVQADNEAAAQARAVAKGAPHKYLCITKCVHPISPARPETQKIWKPGDVYIAHGDEKVPKHFQLVENADDEKKAQDEIDRQSMVSIPPQLAKRAKTVHG